MADAEQQPADRYGPGCVPGGKGLGGGLAPLRSGAALRWHVGAFVAVNVVLGLINAAIGGGWWAFWPLLGTALLLAAHYFFFKALTVGDGWVDERVQELNLKSYDRSHIEDLKKRLGAAEALVPRRDTAR